MATLTIEQFKQKLKKQEKQMLILIDDTLPKLVGVEAISHFSENFKNEGFDGSCDLLSTTSHRKLKIY